MGVTNTATPQLYNPVSGAWENDRTPTVFKPISLVGIAAETAIWTPAGGKRFRLMGYLFALTTANGNITLKDGLAGTTIAVIPCLTNVPVVPSSPLGNGLLSAAINNALTATGPATSVLSGYVWGTEE